LKVDTIVGAGSVGLSALREVRRYTDDFLLVNAGHWGTTCAAVGCMPSKALIEAANAFQRRGSFEECGIRGIDGRSAAGHLDCAAGVLKFGRRAQMQRDFGLINFDGDL
jgi:dihydrolipoamide dehydrogenase